MPEAKTVGMEDVKCPHCGMRIHAEFIEEICENPFNVCVFKCPRCPGKYSIKVMLRIVPQEPDNKEDSPAQGLNVCNTDERR